MIRVELINIPSPFPIMLDPILAPISVPINPAKSHVNTFLENPIGIDIIIAFSICRFFTNAGFRENPPP